MKYVFYVFAGICAGALGGMGMGGGTVLIPLLTILGGVPQHTAQAVNLVAFLPMAAVALVFHIKNKLVDFDGILYTIIPGVAFAAAYSLFSLQVDSSVLKRGFGFFLIALSIFQFFAQRKLKKYQK